MILLSQGMFSFLNWLIVVVFVIINVYITANILKVYANAIFHKAKKE